MLRESRSNSEITKRADKGTTRIIVKKKKQIKHKRAKFNLMMEINYMPLETPMVQETY